MTTFVRRAIYGQIVAGIDGSFTLPSGGSTTLRTLLGAPAPNYNYGIYHNSAPDQAKPPFVIFSKSSGLPTEAFHDPSALETDVWMIKAVDHNTTADTAEAIAGRITSLLNDAALSISGATTLYLRRESDVEYSELIEGDLYQHVGALYRLVTD